jgi:hypothetical protein
LELKLEMFVLIGIEKYDISMRKAIVVTIELEGPHYNIKTRLLLTFQ